MMSTARSAASVSRASVSRASVSCRLNVGVQRAYPTITSRPLVSLHASSRDNAPTWFKRAEILFYRLLKVDEG